MTKAKTGLAKKTGRKWADLSEAEKRVFSGPVKRSATVRFEGADGKNHTVRFSGRSASMVAIDQAAQAEQPDPEIQKRKKVLADKAESAIVEKLEAGDDHKALDRSSKRIQTLAKTMFGRMALREACIRHGIDADTYADVIEKSLEVGMSEHKDARASRKDFLQSYENLANMNSPKEERPPQVVIVIGDMFREASDEIDERRNTGHSMEPAQWTAPGDEEPGEGEVY